MKRNLAPILVLLFACIGAEAAIPLNSLQTFDAAPGATQWTTRNVGGLNSSILSPAALDAVIQTNDVTLITNELSLTAAGGVAILAQWNSSTRCIQTRPTSTAYNVLLATVQNTSGHVLPSVAIGYDFGNPAPVPGAEDAGLNGLRAYYSLTGQPGTWSLIPELSTSQPGSPAALIVLGSWPADSLLYLLWADDNGGGSDSAFTIDNFIALESLPPPPPPRVNATNVCFGRTLQLTVLSGGLGLSYQWYKDGQPINPAINPTAAQSVLIVTNVSFADSGVYRVIVQNAAGSAMSGAIPVIVGCDPGPPRFLLAFGIPDNPRGFRLSTDKLVCTDPSTCATDASVPYNWIISNTGNAADLLVVESVNVKGTNIEFQTVQPRMPGQTYRIAINPAGEGIADIYGNFMASSSSITSSSALLFKQGFNGYGGTQDTEIHAGNLADTVLGAAMAIRADDDEGSVAQGLLRFDNLFGNAAGQVPLGVRILRATLSLTQVDPGGAVNLHRMLIPWDQSSATWNGFSDGVVTDDVEARANVEAVIVPGGAEGIDVTASVQAWAYGGVNHSWLLQSLSTDGFGFASSESGQPPTLTVVVDARSIEQPCVLSAQLPAALSVAEGQSFTLAPALSFGGFCLPTFRWTKNGVNVEGAQNSIFSVPAASVCDAGSYRIIVSSVGGLSVTSNPTVVTVSADLVRPVLTRAFANADGTNITLTFSKVMNATNASNVSHYTLDPPLAVTDANLSSEGRTVTLTTAPRAPLMAYTLRIENVTDNRFVCVGSGGNILSPNPTLVQLTGRRIDLPWNAEWLYSTNNQDATLSTAAPWYTPNFSPGADWFIGQALFGTETSASTVAQFPAPLLTPIPPNTNSPPDQITTYFRKLIDLPPLPSAASYALCHFVDDGAVFYLDGAEIGRVSMTNPPPVLFAHRASTAFDASLQCFPFTAASGSHLLAVEVHQGGATNSSDMLFGVQIESIASILRLDIGTNQPLILWKADSYWELSTSTNVLVPFVPVVVNPSVPLGAYYDPATNPAAFFRLRYKGTAK